MISPPIRRIISGIGVVVISVPRFFPSEVVADIVESYLMEYVG